MSLLIVKYLAHLWVFLDTTSSVTMLLVLLRNMASGCILGKISSAVSVDNILVVQVLEWFIFIIVFYRPPPYNDLENDSLMTFLSEFGIDKNVLMRGQFNLPRKKGRNSYRKCLVQPCYIFRSFILRNISGSWISAANLRADIH